jgi:DNA polymerase IIIc chi subunit
MIETHPGGHTVTTNGAVKSPETFDARQVDDAVGHARAWVAGERAAGTLVGEETLWREAYRVYLDVVGGIDERHRAAAWACIASALVFDTGKVPLNQKVAAREACQAVRSGGDNLARRLHDIAMKHDVDPGRIRGLLGPGVGYPWVFPRALWTSEVVARGLEAMLAPFEWAGKAPDAGWLEHHAVRRPSVEFLYDLGACAPDRSVLRRSLGAVRSLVAQLEDERRDAGVVEAHAFIAALSGYGLSPEETSEHTRDLLALQEAVVLARSFQLYQRAEGLVALAGDLVPADPQIALDFLEKAAAIYKRLAVAQQYPERLLERHRQVWRMVEDCRVEHGIAGEQRADHVLLVGTFHSPTDLQRLLLSVAHELQAFGYGRPVHVVVSDDSTGEARARNEEIYAEASRSGLRITEWGLERRNAFLARLNEEVFADDPFDVNDLAGVTKPGEKGIPYGRLRNFLRLAGLVELREYGLENPIFTWLDQDNELGALVLTRAGTLSKRHVFNYFDQKSDIFSDPRVLVGGGGYTNDALEGVEKFWVAWGIMHTTLGLAREHAPQAPAVLSAKADITRFRPWDQPDTLERLPREGEDVETMSDQFLLLVSTLVGTFRGKYDNQVQIYHPWSHGEVEPGDERLVEEMRAFAGMPGGNTSFGAKVLASPIPFLTVCGRGEDIFHLWQLEAAHGPGSSFLTHTPALHTRNVKAGRGNLMSEIVNSFNGRIFREPPYLWAALSSLFSGQPMAEVEVETAERIDGLRAEAKASMSAVSGLAQALAPFVDEAGEFWWVARAKDDPRCAEVLDTLRAVVDEFKHVEKYHRMADEQLLNLDDVKELTAEFMAAYPHWETVVEKVGGLRLGLAEDETSKLAQTQPRENYGAPMRVEASRTATVSGRLRATEPSALGEPVEDLPWQEALTSAALLFRRYEQGVAERGGPLTWDDRLRRLQAVFDHYAGGLDDAPRFLWARLFRDALFVPHSASYRALTELIEGGEEGVDVDRLAGVHEVDPEVLRLAATGGGVGVPA